MALKKSEKKMLKILAGVAVVSAIILYRVYAPEKEEEIEQLEPTEKKEEKKTSGTSSPSRRGGGGVSRGGGGSRSSTGGGNTDAETTVTSLEFQSHGTIDDCWVLVDGFVLDISPFMVAYPSAQEEASQYCGTFGFEEGFLKNNLQYENAINKGSTKKGVIR